MSVLKYKHKVALDYLFDGKDPLSNISSGNYVKQYGDDLFSEKNVLQNLRAANKLIQKADKIISIDNIDNIHLLNKQSIYANYFSGKGNTAPSTPNKKKKQKKQGKEDIPINMIQQNTSNQSQNLISNNRINTPKYQNNEMENNIQDNQIQNRATYIEDKQTMQIQKNSLHKRTMNELQRIKQLYDKQKYNQSTEQQQTPIIQRSSSAELFIPFGKERDRLGYIIDPIKQNKIEQNQSNKNTQSSIPLEKQKISLIVPPIGTTVLVMKRGVHFFDKGKALKSKRDVNEIIFQTMNKKDIQNPNQHSSNSQQQLNRNQDLQQDKKLQKQDNNTYNQIDNQNQSNISSSKYPNGMHQTCKHNSSVLEKNSMNDQSMISKQINNENQPRSELSSLNNLTSKNTTFHYSGYPRHQSQDSVLTLLNQNKIPDYDNIQNGSKQVNNIDNKQTQNQLLKVLNNEPYYAKENRYKQIGIYNITPISYSPDKIIINGNNSSQQTLNEERLSQSTLNQTNPKIQSSKIENSKHHLNETQTQNDENDMNKQQYTNYQQKLSELSNNMYISNQISNDYICSDPDCVNHGQTLTLTPDIIENNKHEKQKIIYRKHQSLDMIKPSSQSEIITNSIQDYQSSKTMQFDQRKKDSKLQINKESQINEKVDRSASLNITSKNNISLSQIQFMDVKMKQNKGGSVSSFEIGKFVLLSDLNNQTQNSQLSIDKYNGMRQISPIRKSVKIDQDRFKWKMNALDQAQLIELMIKEKESRVKLPKISIYNKRKYTGEQYSSPGGYDPKYECIEKHSRQVYFDKANIRSSSTSPAKKQNILPNMQQKTPNQIPKQKTQLQQKKMQNKEDGYEIMFSELMKDVKREVRQQKVNNKELKHPMQGLLLNPIPHQNIIDLNKNYGNQINYCKKCLNHIKYYLRTENPTIQKRQPQLFNSIYSQFNYIIFKEGIKC